MKRSSLIIGTTIGLLVGSVTALTPAVADTGCPTAATPPQVGSIYQISTPAHLQWIKTDNGGIANGEYRQTADIDMTGCTWNSSIAEMNGTYDGAGFNISNLTVTEAASADDVRGFINTVQATGIVRNVHLRGSSMTTTDNNAGLLVGDLSLGGLISNSSATGSLTAGGNIGGLVGNNNGTIEDSWTDVTVTATSSIAGGLVGLNGNGGSIAGSVRRSYASGAVSGSNSGGLVGHNLKNSTIEDSYSSGAVSNLMAAGLVETTNEGIINRSYSTGAVIAGTYGFVSSDFSGSYSDNFWDTQTSGRTSSGPGGSEATGKTTAQMTSYSTFADAGWSITNGYSTATVWGICPEFNNGYPFLTAIQTANPCTTDPQAAVAEFTYRLPDGRECTSISPERVTIGTVHALPGREALCQTSEGSLVAGWVIPVPEGFTGAGSSALPFNPGHQVYVSGSQQFTLVPFEQVLTITYDSNVAAGDECAVSETANASYASADGREMYVWVPRDDFDMARAPSSAPCTPAGHMLTEWNTGGDGSGQTIELGRPLPESWKAGGTNDHRLYAVWEASPAID